MLWQRRKVREQLACLVRSITSLPHLRADFFEDGLVHLWQTESASPGETGRWYMESCRFCLLHLLLHGRSIDSLKRAKLLCPFCEELDGENCISCLQEPGPSYDCVSARDLFDVMWTHLDDRERQVFEMLVSGWTAREIARTLGVSLRTVRACRKKIAAVARRLGIQN